MLYLGPLCEQRTRFGNCSFGVDYFYHWKCLWLHPTSAAAAGTNEWVAQKWEWGRDLLPLVEAAVSAFLRVEFTPPSPLPAEGMLHSCTPCSFPVFKSHFFSLPGLPLAIEQHVWQRRTGRQAPCPSGPDEQRYLQCRGQRPVTNQQQL